MWMQTRKHLVGDDKLGEQEIQVLTLHGTSLFLQTNINHTWLYLQLIMCCVCWHCFVYLIKGLLPTEATHRESRSMSSGLDIPSGRMRGMAATHVLNKSILGFLSPLKRSRFKFNCKELLSKCSTVKRKLIKHCDKWSDCHTELIK